MDKINALATGTRTDQKEEVKFNGIIEAAQRGKGRGTGWAKDNCEQALIEASLYQFKEVVAPALTTALNIRINCSSTPIGLTSLEQIVKKNVISVPARDNIPITQKIFTNDSWKKFLDYLSQLRKEGNHSISVQQVLDAIQTQKLHTDRVTNRNWRSFLECKKIDCDLFIAFCSILRINHKDVVETSLSTPAKDLTKATRLVEILNTFNHTQQKIIVCTNLAQKNAPKAFLVVNPCFYSRTWMLRRIEHEIRINSLLEVQRESFFSQSRFSPLSIKELDSVCKERFLNLQNIEKILRQKYLFFIINIDCYDLDDLSKLVEKFWQPLLNKIDPQFSGKLILFLVASGQENNWQTQWKEHPILKKSLAELPPAQPFDITDLCEILPRAALRLNIQLTEDITDLSQNIIDKSRGSTEKLLLSFYRKFNCPSHDFNRQWQNYPPS